MLRLGLKSAGWPLDLFVKPYPGDFWSCLEGKEEELAKEWIQHRTRFSCLVVSLQELYLVVSLLSVQMKDTYILVLRMPYFAEPLLHKS